MPPAWMGPRVELWWFLEKRTGHLWGCVAQHGERASVWWLDWLPAFTYRRRKRAERRYWRNRLDNPYER